MRRSTIGPAATDPTSCQGMFKIRTKNVTTSMPFIVSTNLDQTDQTTRKLIRSHVMRRRNREKVKKRQNPEASHTLDSFPEIQGTTHEHVIEQPPLPPPGRYPTYMYFANFPDEIEPQLLMIVAQGSYNAPHKSPGSLTRFAVAPIATRILFPLLTSINYNAADIKPWLDPSVFASDPLTLHINAFAYQNFVDTILRRRPRTENSPLASQHLQKSLALLRGTLVGDNDEKRIADATIGAVLKLATAAMFYGDFKTAWQHMQGLGKMVHLRGGLQAFNYFPTLLMEILRCDLSIALLMNLDPVFYSEANDSMLRILTTPDTTVPSTETTQFLSSLDQNLTKVWLATKRFCLMVNMDAETGTPLLPTTLHETMTSLMYRLLHMTFPPGTPDETIRLGLLVFTNHVFLQGKGIHIHCEEFSQNYRNHLMGGMMVSVPHHVMLWLLMVGAVSLFDQSQEPWLVYSLLEWTWKLGVRSWEDLQAVLMESMWIPVLDGHAVAEVYGSLVTI